MNIRGKLLIVQIVTLFIICVGLGGVSVLNSTKAITDQVEQGLNDKVVDNVQYLEERFKRSFAELEGISAHDTIRSMDWEEQRVYLENELKNLDYLTLAIVTPDGIAHYLDDTTLDLGDRDYVIKAFDGESAMSEIIISRATNEPVMMLASPIKNNDDVVGVLIARIDGFYLSEIVDSIKFGETGYAFLLNAEGTFLGHENRDLVVDEVNYIELENESAEMKNNAEIVRRITSNETGIFNYTYEGIKRYVAFDTLDNGWKLIVGAHEDEVASGISSLQTSLIIFIIVAIILGVIIAYFFANSISRPIREVTESGQRLAEGDLTIKINPELLKKSDEVGGLANTFATVTKNMNEMLQQVNNSAFHVDQAVEEMMEKADMTTNMVEETNSLIEGVAETAEMQLTATQESATSIQEMATGTQRIAEIATEVTEFSRDIQQRADLGEDLLEQSVSQMTNIEQSTLGMTEVMDELKGTSEEVTQITQMITDISEQTNLLALNASIEAARAGEAGQGFAVVADEIRNLSEQTATSASEINRLINNIQDDTTTAVRSTNENRNDVEKGIELMTTLKSDFQIIFESLDDIHEQMNDLSALAEQMSAGTEEVSAAVEEMSATTTNATDHIQDVHDKTNEQLKVVEEIQTATSTLKQTAEQLRESVQQFKV